MIRFDTELSFASTSQVVHAVSSTFTGMVVRSRMRIETAVIAGITDLTVQYHRVCLHRTQVERNISRRSHFLFASVSVTIVTMTIERVASAVCLVDIVGAACFRSILPHPSKQFEILQGPAISAHWPLFVNDQVIG